LATLDASSFSAMPLFYPEQMEDGMQPQRVREWYWYSKLHWETNKRVIITATIDRKLQALYAYASQMVLTIDDLLGEARALGVDETLLAGIDPLQYQPLIDMGLRANDARTGAECGAEYAEAFRYHCLELPEIFQG
jgi:hypothetical protein